MFCTVLYRSILYGKQKIFTSWEIWTKILPISPSPNNHQQIWPQTISLSLSFLSPTFSKLLKFPLHFRWNHFLIYTVHKLIIFIILQSFIRFQQFIIFEHQKMCFPKTFNFPINQLKVYILRISLFSHLIFKINIVIKRSQAQFPTSFNWLRKWGCC